MEGSRKSYVVRIIPHERCHKLLRLIANWHEIDNPSQLAVGSRRSKACLRNTREILSSSYSQVVHVIILIGLIGKFA